MHTQYGVLGGGGLAPRGMVPASSITRGVTISVGLCEQSPLQQPAGGQHESDSRPVCSKRAEWGAVKGIWPTSTVVLQPGKAKVVVVMV